MLHRARYYHGKSSVCPFLCPSVTLMYGWNFSKIISQLISLRCLLSAGPNITDLLQGEHPRNFGRNWGGVQKKWLSAFKSLVGPIYDTRQDKTKVTVDDQ